jgi:hypothetical protein
LDGRQVLLLLVILAEALQYSSTCMPQGDGSETVLCMYHHRECPHTLHLPPNHSPTTHPPCPQLRLDNSKLRTQLAAAAAAPPPVNADPAAAAAAAQAAMQAASAGAEVTVLRRQVKEFTVNTQMELEKKLVVSGTERTLGQS